MFTLICWVYYRMGPPVISWFINHYVCQAADIHAMQWESLKDEFIPRCKGPQLFHIEELCIWCHTRGQERVAPHPVDLLARVQSLNYLCDTQLSIYGCPKYGLLSWMKASSMVIIMKLPRLQPYSSRHWLSSSVTIDKPLEGYPEVEPQQPTGKSYSSGHLA